MDNTMKTYLVTTNKVILNSVNMKNKDNKTNNLYCTNEANYPP